MKGINTHCSITINVNDLNFPIKRFRLTDWIIKENLDIFVCFFSTSKNITHDQYWYYHGVKWWENVCQENRTKKQAVLAILISDKIDSKPKQFRREGKWYYYSLKGQSTKKILTF